MSPRPTAGYNHPVRAAALLLVGFSLPLHAQTGAPSQAAEPHAPTLLPPEIVAEVTPTYPDDAFLDGVHGPVTLDVDIDDEGRVFRSVVREPADPRLAWAALGAACNMEFVPARTVADDGTQTPVAVRIAYTFTFTIDEAERERELEADEARRLMSERATAPVNLTGRVLVAGERLSLSGVVVSIADTDLEVVTDEAGAFSLRGVPEGLRQIRVDATGYEPGLVVEEIKAHLVTDVVVYLVRRADARDETVVRERRTQREVTKRVLTQKELTRVPGTFGDAIRVVQRLPGVARAPFGLGAVLVRGGAPEDTTILIDGHLSRLLFHLGAGPSVINTDLVERLEFFPGGQGVRFGRAIAGAIDVVTRDPRADTYSAKATVDLLQTGFRLEGPLTSDGKIAFFAAGRTSYVAEVLNTGDLIARFVDEDVNFLTLAPRYSDYQAKLLWKLPYNQSVVVNWFGSHDRLDFALDPSQLGPQAPSNVGITTGFHRLNPVWRIKSADENDDGQPVVRAWVSPIIETTYTQNRFDASQFSLDVNRTGLRAEVEFRPVAGLGLLIGTDDSYALFSSKTDLPLILPDERLFPRPTLSDPPRSLIEDEVFGTSSSFYVEGDLTIGPLTLLAGGRADLLTYYDQTRSSFDPRFSARAAVLPGVVLKGNVGLYHQATSPFFMAKRAGNPDLPLEKGWQFGGGAEVWLTRSLDVNFELFLRTADDLAEAVISPVGFFPSGAPRIQSIGHERAYGAEFMLRQRLDHGVFGWISYTLMRAEERQDRPDGIEGATATKWTVVPYDQTHILSIAVSGQLPWHIELGGALRYVTGNPVTAAGGGQLDADTGRHQRYAGVLRGSRLPGFFQLDARIDRKFTFDTWSLSLYCDLQNATNHQNYELFQYNYDFTVREGFPGLPILPVIGAEASF